MAVSRHQVHAKQGEKAVHGEFNFSLAFASNTTDGCIHLVPEERAWNIGICGKMPLLRVFSHTWCFFHQGTTHYQCKMHQQWQSEQNLRGPNGHVCHSVNTAILWTGLGLLYELRQPQQLAYSRKPLTSFFRSLRAWVTLEDTTVSSTCWAARSFVSGRLGALVSLRVSWVIKSSVYICSLNSQWLA